MLRTEADATLLLQTASGLKDFHHFINRSAVRQCNCSVAQKPFSELLQDRELKLAINRKHVSDTEQRNVLKHRGVT
jgi:hypothetical protein